jgi:site-specific DNA-methyltransferase (cytosine-N4-specific)
MSMPSIIESDPGVDISEMDWNFWNAETDHLTHGIHRYSGKFIPQIAAQAIELLTKPGELVLDPYCGSGTALLEAAVSGRRAIGNDLSPLAILIARVKTTPVAPSELDHLCQTMAGVVSDLEVGDLLSRGADAVEDWRLQDDWFAKWFSEPVLGDLVTIDHAIQALESDNLRNAARVAFSDVLRRSSNAHQGYPNVMFDRRGGPRPRPGKPFLKALRSVCSAIASLEPFAARLAGVKVISGDAADLPIDSETVDAVIAHPPYVGSIPYAEYGALSLKWLGHDPKQLDKVLTGGQRQSKHVLTRFEIGYQKMLESSYRVLKPGRSIFLLVGNPTIKGDLVDLADITVTRAEAVGFRNTGRTTRSGQNRRSNQMGDEIILVFQKG